jgi:hypothetical protein
MAAHEFNRSAVLGSDFRIGTECWSFRLAWALLTARGKNMTFKRFTRTTLGLIGTGGLIWGCSSQSDDCASNKDCGSPAGTAGYAAAAGVSGGSGGSGGGSGSGGGNAGVSGSGGKSGSGGGGGGASGATGISGNSGSGAAGEAGSAGAPEPPACDASANPAVDACVIADAYALFVSPTGSNDASLGDGTEAKPFATVSKALSALGPSKPARIYVCAGVYLEPAALSIPDRAAIYGGFSCDGGLWSYDATLKSRAQLKSPTPLGGTIDSATHGVTLQDVRIDAANAPEDGTGTSSFGLLVNASAGVVLERVEIHAGKGGGGKAGADGATGADGVTSGAAQNGAGAKCVAAPGSQDGGRAAAIACGSQGGDGGSGRLDIMYANQQDGAPGLPSVNVVLSPNPNGGMGALLVGIGHPGLPGITGSAGNSGSQGTAAKALGVFSATGYVPASGGTGTPGFPGQGGGGGGASLGTLTCVGASGGAGGMGGCGGDPGTGGIGGGASIALLSLNSAVSIDGCVLVSSAGGAGGRGGNAHTGGSGKAGGAGGNGDAVNAIVGGGGDGGKGGTGGTGGNGAGGTGGPSIALLYSGTRPTDAHVAATLTAGLGGALGVGGKVGVLPGRDGQFGKSATEYAIAP